MDSHRPHLARDRPVAPPRPRRHWALLGDTDALPASYSVEKLEIASAVMLDAERIQNIILLLFTKPSGRSACIIRMFLWRHEHAATRVSQGSGILATKRKTEPNPATRTQLNALPLSARVRSGLPIRLPFRMHGGAPPSYARLLPACLHQGSSEFAGSGSRTFERSQDSLGCAAA